MKLVHVYLHFPGTCEEAFTYYAGIFGTKVDGLIRFGEASFAGPVSEADKPKVMNVHMPITETVHLMGSDWLEGRSGAFVRGNSFNISLVADSKEEADRVFARLSFGGTTAMPMANAPWGPYFGMCTDKFGVQWMVSLDHPVA